MPVAEVTPIVIALPVALVHGRFLEPIVHRPMHAGRALDGHRSGRHRNVAGQGWLGADPGGSVVLGAEASSD